MPWLMSAALLEPVGISYLMQTNKGSILNGTIYALSWFDVRELHRDQ